MSTMVPSPSFRHAVAINDSIGARIVAALTESGMTQSELARQLVGPSGPSSRVESTRRLLNKWIRDLHVPGPVHAQRLAAVLGKPTDYFTTASVAAGLPAATSTIPATALPAGPGSYAREFVWEASESTEDELPRDSLKKSDIAKLAPFFYDEHILLDRVDAYEPGEAALAVAQLSHRVWDKPNWYRLTKNMPGAPKMIPGILVLEALAQTASVALLTGDKYRGRTVLCAGYDHIRLRKPVAESEELHIYATLHAPPRNDAAFFDVWATKANPVEKASLDNQAAAEDVVADGVVLLMAH